MNFKKRVNGSWTDIPHYVHNTSTDTLTTLPAVIYPNDTTATVGLKGQMVQSSIPSPTSPVMPNGTGERTGNLFDITTLENGIYLAANGNKYGNVTNGVRSGVKIKALPNTAYTLSAQFSENVSLRIFEWSNGTFTKQTPKYNISGNASLTVTTDAETTEIAFNIEGENGQYATNIMLNTGSTPLPYENFGYKIPISSASTTTPVYLGEVQTTRKIRKLVLTGEETFGADIEYNRFFFTIQDMRSEGVRLTKLFCTHYQNISDGRPIANVPDNSIYTGGGTDSQKVFIKTTDYTTAVNFKSYLAQQYAAGTPVTIWYVLASETTGIVNEPLMKIGEYADTLSNISIPVTAGGDTLSVDTTLQPSEVTVNYKGWHPVADVHERENGAWT